MPCRRGGHSNAPAITAYELGALPRLQSFGFATESARARARRQDPIRALEHPTPARVEVVVMLRVRDERRVELAELIEPALAQRRILELGRPPPERCPGVAAPRGIEGRVGEKARAADLDE